MTAMTHTETAGVDAVITEVKSTETGNEKPMLQIWLDGKFVPENEAKVSVFDHGLLYGDGCFEGIRVYNNRIFKLRSHVQRLFDSAKSISLEIPYSIEELEEVMREGVRLNNVTNGYIRPVVTRGYGDLGINPLNCPKPTVFIITAVIQLYPKEIYTTGMKIISAKRPRVNREALNPAVKSLNYLNNILTKLEAEAAGVPEAVMCNSAGYVAECTGDNIFFIKDGTVVTPPLEAGCLGGITRAFVIEMCSDLDIPCEERLFRIDELKAADEVFLTGTAAEIVSVIQIDDDIMGDGKPGSVTDILLSEFRNRIAENAPED